MAAITSPVARWLNPLLAEERRFNVRPADATYTVSALPKHALVGQRLGSELIENMTARPDLICRGVPHDSVPAPTSSTSHAVPVQSGRIQGMANSASAPLVAGDFGKICYAEDNNTIRANDGDIGDGPVYSIAGIFDGFQTPEGTSVVQTVLFVPEYPMLIPALLQGLIASAFSAASGGVHVIDGAVTSAVADLDAFTVAGHDGNTFTVNDLVFLLNQTAPEENGPWIVGTVATGVAALTRPSWWSDGSIQAPGAGFFIATGVTGAGLTFFSSALAEVGADDAAFKLADSQITSRAVTGLITTDIPDLAACAVSGAGRDGNTYVEDDVILAVLQTTATQSGPWVVGAVATTAPLTRPVWWFNGSDQPAAFEFVPSKGTIGRGQQWYATLAGPIVVGTSSPAFYPRQWSAVSAAMTGTPGAIAVTGLWIHATTGIHPTFSRETTGGTPGHVSGVVVAGPGTGSVTLTSTGNETSTFALAGHN